MNKFNTSSMHWQILCLLTCCFSLSLNSQIVESSCDASESISSIYSDDAATMTYWYVRSNDTEYSDDVELPMEYRNRFLDALLAVYNATEIPVNDTIFNVLEIHNRTTPILDRVELTVDIGTYWLQDVLDGKVTGYEYLDKLIESYPLTASSLYEFSDGIWIQFELDNFYNTDQFAKMLEELDGVQWASRVIPIGGGNSIRGMLEEDHVSITYNSNWGDCPSGCTNNENWNFKVYHDCSVEFIDDQSNIASDIGSIENFDFNAYPNPFHNEIKLDGNFADMNFQIVGLDGKVLKEGVLVNNRIEQLEHLVPNSYILKIFNEDFQSVKTIVKQ